jgi:hypothetical protein
MRNPQPIQGSSATRCKSLSNALESHSISLEYATKQGDEWRGSSLTQSMSQVFKKSRERALKTGQATIYKHPQRIEPLGSRCRSARVDRTPWSDRPDAATASGCTCATSPMLATCPFFESRSLDFQRSQNVTLLGKV